MPRKLDLRLAFAVNTIIKNYPVEMTVCGHLFCFLHQISFRMLIPSYKMIAFMRQATVNRTISIQARKSATAAEWLEMYFSPKLQHLYHYLRPSLFMRRRLWGLPALFAFAFSWHCFSVLTLLDTKRSLPHYSESISGTNTLPNSNYESWI